ncbi:hypothetical protein Pmani_034573 [Petrolisthes manimaculis]|uniref:Uncharacterized protein n=1 Tax=Petrolisthes manimaculis TaxID=1843537 RepID=A0AAE1NP13_9EUCA|nr:hypothetical protein Pmani_034573 [Petrolisthes manimaculis]
MPQSPVPMNQATSTMDTQEPPMNQATSTMDTQEPPMNQATSTMDTQEPSMNQATSTMDIQEPPMNQATSTMDIKTTTSMEPLQSLPKVPVNQARRMGVTQGPTSIVESLNYPKVFKLVPYDFPAELEGFIKEYHQYKLFEKVRQCLPPLPSNKSDGEDNKCLKVFKVVPEDFPAKLESKIRQHHQRRLMEKVQQCLPPLPPK